MCIYIYIYINICMCNMFMVMFMLVFILTRLFLLAFHSSKLAAQSRRSGLEPSCLFHNVCAGCPVYIVGRQKTADVHGATVQETQALTLGLQVYRYIIAILVPVFADRTCFGLGPRVAKATRPRALWSQGRP